jgi:hypothetical protein
MQNEAEFCLYFLVCILASIIGQKVVLRQENFIDRARFETDVTPNGDIFTSAEDAPALPLREMGVVGAQFRHNLGRGFASQIVLLARE